MTYTLRNFLASIIIIGAVAAVCSAASESFITGDVRIQPLSETLVRMEVRGPKGFEDRPTFHIQNRDLGCAEAEKVVRRDNLIVKTSAYSVNIPQNAENLDKAYITDSAGKKIWSKEGDSKYFPIITRWPNSGGGFLYDKGELLGHAENGNTDEFLWKKESKGGWFRLKNKATGDYIYIDSGKDKVYAGKPDNIKKAEWKGESAGAGYVRLKNRAYPKYYIHIENQKGYAEAATKETINDTNTPLTRWYSANWKLDKKSINRRYLPEPTEKTKAWMIADEPRYVPSRWEYNPAPEGVENNGWDMSNNAEDIYVFLPQGNWKRLRQDFIELTGKTNLVPLYALGGWDSRYHPYTQKEALNKIKKYQSKDIPLDVFVVDTDWRVGASIGYDINKKLFPDMERFISNAHDLGKKIMFNDHPEPQAEALEREEVLYRNDGLRGLFDIGLDFWWFDRNWHTCINPPEGIAKEVFGMYIYDAVTRDYYPHRRPLIMANYDGIDHGKINRPSNIAAHRYSIQWTGDTRSHWNSLKDEVRNAVFAGVYGPFPYLSTDVGGHMGELTTEQYCRWVQFGTLSPIFRLHCGRKYTRDPWDYDEPCESVVREFMQMRMRLLPVLYTAARENYETGEPIIKRCDLLYPEYEEAKTNHQYLIGDDILFAPVYEPMKDSPKRSLWLPPGKWINAFTGEVLEGGEKIAVELNLETAPLFVRSGSVIPLAPNMLDTTKKPWEPVTLDIYPSSKTAAKAELYEDDRMSRDYEDGFYRETAFSCKPEKGGKVLNVKISEADGAYQNSLKTRSWKLRIHKPEGVKTISKVLADGKKASFKTIRKDSGKMPFAVEGGSPDGDVFEITLPEKSVYQSRNVKITFE
ncbi:glycoside hydrolase family 31 protein [Sedimentisphaera salicampi]|uniref:glycoside hydrolase family 31 protein n=1 Tax=Sedimentisphaera salicampi TaxID=1941349 RepID=UPI000B9BAFCF|nr:TIM-barrel domain-containing protein [Sedimentisphaera salicampi]OXU14692.1 Alpha-xylosidase [Sedimentisphaera salicampi]